MKIFREIKHAWQRVFRGWDDSAVWDIDLYLSKQIVEILTEFKKKKNSVPGSLLASISGRKYPKYTKEDVEMARERWDEILDIIIKGFSYYARLGKQEEIEKENGVSDYCSSRSDNESFQTAFEYLKKYWGDLWE